MTDDQQAPGLERLPTGVPGLDRILNGGFLRGGAYIVNGVPGTGKTTLANQICFNHAASGGCAVYVTLLTETHARMIQHLRPMSFFDEDVIPDRLYYISALKVLEEEGPKGMVDLLQREMRAARAGLMVLDGFSAAAEATSSTREFKKLVLEIQAHAAANECTMLLLTTDGIEHMGAEHAMLDGIVDLEDDFFQARTERGLRIRKFRGSSFLRGRHSFRITPDGLVFHPRIEAALARHASRDLPSRERVPTGVGGLDRMLDGGLMAATTSVVMGPTGIGKTMLGFHFVAQSSAEEPGLFFGFFEPPERLRRSAARKGLDIEDMEARGALEIVWQPQGEHILDELGYRLLDAVSRRGARRLFIDGLDSFMEAAVHPERITRFISTLANELRALGVTSIFTIEMREIMGSSVAVPIEGISALLESMLLLRFVDDGDAVRRVASVVKIRDSGFDPRPHAFEITGSGMRVLGPRRSHDGESRGKFASAQAGPPASSFGGEG